jgi:hypothetical protein
VVTPDDPIDTVEAVARAYQPRWLVLERADIVRALTPVLRGEGRPSWVGTPLFTVPAEDGGPPRLELYPVCLDAADRRCSTTAS